MARFFTIALIVLVVVSLFMTEIDAWKRNRNRRYKGLQRRNRNKSGKSTREQTRLRRKGKKKRLRKARRKPGRKVGRKFKNERPVDIYKVIKKAGESFDKHPDPGVSGLPEGYVLTEEDILVTAEEKNELVQKQIDEMEKDKMKRFTPKSHGKRTKKTGSKKRKNQKTKKQKKNKRRRRKYRGKRSVAQLDGLWPKSDDGKVYVSYQTTGYNSKQKQMIKDAVNIYSKYTCIRFQENYSTKSYINIKKDSGCYSIVGKSWKDEGQILSLTDDCFQMGVVLHEFLHTLGMWHEQSRHDRDNYIKLSYKLYNDPSWKIYPKDETNLYSTPYDFRSVMHYSPDETWGDRSRFSMLQQKDLAGEVGRGKTLSYYDVMAITKRYSCNEKCQPANCGKGFQAADCSCYCYSEDPKNPIVNCGVVCLEVEQSCKCYDRENACDDISNTECAKSGSKAGQCVCKPGYFLVDGVCKKPSDRICNKLNENCLCSLKDYDGEGCLTKNSVCDYDTDKCVCDESRAFYELSPHFCFDTNLITCVLGQTCHCHLQTTGPGCTAIPNSSCNKHTGMCDCDNGYVRLSGSDSCTPVRSLTCNILGDDCGCSNLDEEVCDGLPNSFCDGETNACECEEDYYDRAGKCEQTPDCTELDENCLCSKQGEDACENVPHSRCDMFTDVCVCGPGYERKDSQCKLLIDFSMNGDRISPFIEGGSHSWAPHSTKTEGALRRYDGRAGYYLLAHNLNDEDMKSEFTLDTPLIIGNWCADYTLRQSHAHIIFEYKYNDEWKEIYDVNSSSGETKWWRYGVKLYIDSQKFQIRVRVKRYNKGNFFVAIDKAQVYKC